MKMQIRKREIFTSVRTEGAILPSDLLQRIAHGDRGLGGLAPDDYHLAGGEKINEAISRSWNRLQGAWKVFQATAGRLSEGDPGTTPTRERWLLPLFQELGYGRLLAARATEIDGRSYPVSHGWGHVPMHLVGCGVQMDRPTAGVAGAARTSPHSLLQELLNRSEAHLWGFVSNGLRLRILRDNASLTRQAYVEFDLEAMMAGEAYADFAVLWLLCHQSRVEAERPEECWLEKWSRLAQEQGTRVLEQLRRGVEAAIAALGKGFLAHPGNRELRDALRTGTLAGQDYYRQLLRLVYRLIFLFVAEDRDLLLVPDADRATRDRYERFYSTTRLRRLAERRRGTQHGDLFCALRLVMEKLGSDAGCPPLGLPALGSFLWLEAAIAALRGCEIANSDLLDAVYALSMTHDGQARRPVDYRNLGAEELGSVYEALLELHPVLHLDSAGFELQTAGGNERKTTGSYYTPASLVACLLDSALDPVLDEACRKPDPEAAVLGLRVCDPACGSGHFLIAAAHRIARRLAAIRTGDEEPAPPTVRKALRDVVGRCLYGVDVNEMAVELCKVSLWLEALEPGKPLGFLDAHIQHGNSLLGATPALLRKGIPDVAFDPIEGDDKAVCTEFRKRNRKERESRGQMALFDPSLRPWEQYTNVPKVARGIEDLPSESVSDVRKKQSWWEALQTTPTYQSGSLLANAWCSTFVWKKTKEFSYPITEEVFRQIEHKPDSIESWMLDEIERLRGQFHFFHWHLAFPGVFEEAGPDEEPDNRDSGWVGGFDVVLGNPPWERVKLQEKEWFAGHRPDIANAENTARRREMIDELSVQDPALYRRFLEDRRVAEAESHLVRDMARYPLCGRGDVNTYAIFTETNRAIINPTGRVGCIVPSGIAVDDTTKFFFQDLIERGSLVSLYSFENEELLFPAVHHFTKFCLLTMTGKARPAGASDFVFFARQVSQLSDPDRHFSLSGSDLALMNPNTRTCPTFRRQRDAEITKAIYRRVSVLVADEPASNSWGIRFATLFHMSGDSALFRTACDLYGDEWQLQGNVFYRDGYNYLPLYEGKMLWQFDHRFGTYSGQSQAQANQGKLPELSADHHADALLLAMPRYWVPVAEVRRALQDRWGRDWLLGWRDTTNVVNERTLVASIFPTVGAGHTLPVAVCGDEHACHLPLLVGNLDSFVLDYVARQKIGGMHLTFGYIRQLPVLPPGSYLHPWCGCGPLGTWVLSRVLELTYTAWDLEPFAKDCGYEGPPFRWDGERRFLLRCELDAAFFHLYGIARDDVAYIMETFPIVRRRDEERHQGEYRTKMTILRIYDAMQRAIDGGESYETVLNPPPADPRVAHPPRQQD